MTDDGLQEQGTPQPVSSREFIRQLARAMHRPYWLPIPAFGLRFILGGMSALVLAGQYLLPEHLLELGFRFKFEKLEHALQDLLE
jgi:NAD dependent epimerase/dehydratase family enzyme